MTTIRNINEVRISRSEILDIPPEGIDQYIKEKLVTAGFDIHESITVFEDLVTFEVVYQQDSQEKHIL